MESAIYQACVNANVVSLHAIETGVSALRQKFDATPESVSDEDIFLMVETIERATIPALSIVSAIDNDSNIADRVVSFLWKNIVDKPTTFPPATHTHPWSKISYKPISFPPATHTHPGLTTDWDALTSKPTTFPPNSHPHVTADVTDFPASLPGRMAVVSWVGNGAGSRILSLSGGFVPRYGLVEYVAVGWALPCKDGIYWSSVSETAITIDAALNTNGYTYRMFIFE